MKARVILSAFFFLTGCAGFEPHPLAPAQTAARLQERSLADPSLRAFLKANLHRDLGAEQPPTWDFDALTLAAFYFHPDLDVARAQWGVAEAGRIAAGERPNPTTGLAPAYNTTTADPSPRLLTLTSDITLETAGKRGYRIAQAEQLSEAARLNITSVAWKVRSSVRGRLLDLYSARESQALLEQQQTLHADNVRILEAQYREGAISAFELTQARLAADSARLALRDAERQRAEARVQLAEAIGVPAGALDGAAFSFDAFSELPADVPAADIRRQALSNRADILGALAEYAASQSKLQLEIARQYPDIHLGPGYEYDQGDNKWSVGLPLTLPVNRNRGAIAEAQAQRAEAGARFNALQARVLGEIDLAVAGYRAARRKQADASAMLADLTQQEKVARAMLDAGEISGSDLAALRLQLSVSALARLDALVQAQRAAGQLEDAIQSPLGLPPSVWQNAPRAADFRAEKDPP
jgi:cobalt-zinc-cadmium efflux system outer membrane protein